MRQIVRRKVASLQHGPNARSHLGPEAELRSLGQSLAKRQQMPLLIRPDGTVIDGNRRLAASLLAGIQELDCIIIEGDISPDEIASIQLVSAIHRCDLSAYDKAVAVREIKAARGWSNKQVAEELDLDAGTITKLLSLFDCDQEVQDAAKAGSVGPTDWYAVARAKDQAEALRLKLTGATRDELERHIRAERCESQEVRTGADGRATSITLPLEDGVTFSVKGPGISIDAAIAHAEKAIAKLKQARGDGHTARTIKHWLKNKKPKKVKT